MTERLSQEHLNGILDAGHRGFAKLSKQEEHESLFPKLDLKAIISSPSPKKQIQNLPPQVLFHSLVRAGLSDCLEVLPLLSSEQFVRICDYDIWHEDRLVAKQAFHWLGFYREVSPSQMYERFRQLDEEYQVALLSPFCTIFTHDEYEKMTEEQQDLLYRFPNDALYYSVNTGDADLHKGICSLVDAAMGEDMSYAMTLLSTAALSPPNEQEELIRQFRNARLEEDGFLSYEESLSFFTPLDPESEFALDDFAHSQSKEIAVNEESQASFLSQVIDQLKNTEQSQNALDAEQSLLHLANAMCGAAKVEPDDLSGLKDLLQHTSSLVSFSLETLSQGNPTEAATILRNHHPKKIFQWGLGLIQQLRTGMLASIKQSTMPTKITEAFIINAQAQKFGLCQEALDRSFLPILGQEHTEVLKGLFNRFPLAPLQITKGQGQTYIAFKPISSLTDFKRLISACEALTSKLQLVSNACREEQSTASTSLDTLLMQAFIQTSLGKPFTSQAPNQADVENFYKLTDLKTPKDFCTEISSFLQNQSSWLSSKQGFVRSKLANVSALSIKTLEECEALYKRLCSNQDQSQGNISDLLDKLTSTHTLKTKAPTQAQGSNV